MKNSINLVFALLLSFTIIAPAQLNADPMDGLKKLIVKASPSTTERAIELRISNLEKEFTKVKVMDVWGYTLYTEYVNKRKGYSKLVKLNNLPNGDYLLHIDHPTGTFNHAFHLDKETVSFFTVNDGENGQSRFTGISHDAENVQGQFSTKANNLHMQLEGLSGAQVNVHVCNLKGKIFFNKKMKGQHKLAMEYSTKKLPKGEFMMVIRTAEKTIIQPFEKSADGLQLKNVLVSNADTNDEEIFTDQ